MAAKLQLLKSKACHASKVFAEKTKAYHKEFLEYHKQYLVEPPTIEKCEELRRQLLVTRVASIPIRYENFWKELDYVKNLWKIRSELTVEHVAVGALFGIECCAFFTAGEVVGRGFTISGYYP